MLMVAVHSGIVIFAHGSSVASANDAVKALAQAAAAAGGYELVETAFLEAPPSLAQAVSNLIDRGATRIVVLPYFLTLGIHLQRDLPAIAAEIGLAHPEVRIQVTPPLDGHPALVGIVLDRLNEALLRT